MYYKKILLVFILISASLISISQDTVDIQLDSITDNLNNNASNECLHDVIVNNKPLTKANSLSFNLSETGFLYIKVICTESHNQDPKFYHNSKIIDLNKIDLSTEYNFKIELSVNENINDKARLQKTGGNNAKWVYRFKIK